MSDNGRAIGASERRKSQKSITLNAEDKTIIQVLHSFGFYHKRIAALFDVNQGRISEICGPEE